MASGNGARRPNKWVMVGIMVMIAIGLYASIIYKVAYYGP